MIDEPLADYDHGWEYAATGTPVPRLERDMLAAVVIGPGTPLQLRSGGVFRGMVTDQDADAAWAAITELGEDVTVAAGKIASVNTRPSRRWPTRVVPSGNPSTMRACRTEPFSPQLRHRSATAAHTARPPGMRR